MKNMLKSNKHKKVEVTSNHAITLITLVITIIILLILAGVAINITIGENGLFTRAKYAKKQMEKASIIEQIQTEIIEKQIENESQKIDSESLEKILEKYGEVQKDQEGNITGVKINDNMNIKLEEILGENEVANSGNSGQEDKKNMHKVIFKGTNVTLEGESEVEDGTTYTAILNIAPGYTFNGYYIEMNKEPLSWRDVSDEIIERIPELYNGNGVKIENVTADIEITSCASTYMYPVDYSANGIEKWQMLYKDELGNTFITPKYVLEVEEFPTDLSFEKISNSENKMKWNLKVDGKNKVVEKSVKNIFMSKGEPNEPVDNSRLLLYNRILDTSIWEKFVTQDLKSKGCMAIGAPSLEMMIKVTNQMQINKKYTVEKSTEEDKDYIVKNEEGNIISNFLEGEQSYQLGTNRTTAIRDGRKITPNCEFYLSTFSNTYRIYNWDWNASVGVYSYTSNGEKDKSFLPVIYIPASIGTSYNDATGMWEIN